MKYMPEYIEREALLRDIEESVRFTVQNAPSAEMRGAHKIIDRIKCAPAADVVPVVRCKECKHQRERNTEEQVYLIDGVLICTSPDATDECWNPVFPNHFCSYGERRERE